MLNALRCTFRLQGIVGVLGLGWQGQARHLSRIQGTSGPAGGSEVELKCHFLRVSFRDPAFLLGKGEEGMVIVAFVTNLLKPTKGLQVWPSAGKPGLHPRVCRVGVQERLPAAHVYLSLGCRMLPSATTTSHFLKNPALMSQLSSGSDSPGAAPIHGCAVL